jgi:hypothetical protein
VIQRVADVEVDLAGRLSLRLTRRDVHPLEAQHRGFELALAEDVGRELRLVAHLVLQRDDLELRVRVVLHLDVEHRALELGVVGARLLVLAKRVREKRFSIRATCPRPMWTPG